jgi:predicted small lipoprotein YifL
MVRHFPVTTLPLRVTSRVHVRAACAAVIAALALAACGIKGPLKLPPASSTAPATAPAARAPAPAPHAPAPAQEAPPPVPPRTAPSS